LSDEVVKANLRAQFVKAENMSLPKSPGSLSMEIIGVTTIPMR